MSESPIGEGVHPRLAGCLVLVVGPSGAGKDSLIDAARHRFCTDPRFVFPRRTITRAHQSHEMHRWIPDPEFDAGVREGEFLLYWEAHGHKYAIPGDTAAELAQGRIAVANVSRTIIRRACARIGNVRVIQVTADIDTLHARLAARGREAESDIARRVERATAIALPEGCEAATVDNSGDLQTAITQFLAILENYAATDPPASLKN